MDKIKINNEFSRKFPDEESVREYLEYRRWGDRIICPYCDKSETRFMKGSQCYQCNMCHEKFTVRTGMIFERSRIPLNKWLYTMWLFAVDRKRASSSQLSKEIGITQKSAWFMLDRLREACGDDEEVLGVVDGAYIDGKDDINLGTTAELAT